MLVFLYTNTHKKTKYLNCTSVSSQFQVKKDCGMSRLCWTVESPDSVRKTILVRKDMLLNLSSNLNCLQGKTLLAVGEPACDCCPGNKIKLPLMLVLVMASSDFYLQPRLGKSLI